MKQEAIEIQGHAGSNRHHDMKTFAIHPHTQQRHLEEKRGK